MGGHRLASSGSEQGQVVVSCKHSNEPWSSIKQREFLDYLRNYWLLKKTLLHGVSYFTSFYSLVLVTNFKFFKFLFILVFYEV